MHETLVKVLEFLERRGHSLYGGEAVTQLQHGLQAASLARKEGASSALIAASLLHDIGHLLHDLPDDAPDAGVDDVHEALGADFLDAHFTVDVVEPVRLHVAAKRYLCATDADYFKKLSGPSIQSLALQGGPMAPEEVVAFEKNPYFRDAVRLRLWDEAAKDPDWAGDALSTFLPELTQHLK
jgi:phosphonate degradation associated HDIG domain protein